MLCGGISDSWMDQNLMQTKEPDHYLLAFGSSLKKTNILDIWALPNKNYHHNEMRIIDLFSSIIFTTQGKQSYKANLFLRPLVLFLSFQ